jgi:hypothetical protein
MGDRGRGTRTYVVILLLSLCAGLGTVLTPATAPAATPSRPAASPCATGRLHADLATTRIRPRGCRLTGRQITHGPLSTRVPARGHGVVLTGLGRRGEWSLDVRTRHDGVVVVRTGSPRPRISTGALAPTNDTLAAATALPLPWSVAGTTSEATADADDQAAADACDAANLGAIPATNPSVWYSVTPSSDVALVTGMQVTASTSDYGYDVNAYLDIFTRDSGGALVAVACGLPDGETPRLQSGLTYYLQVFSSGGTADFVMTGRPPSASELPPNDAYAAAAALPLDQNVLVGNYDRASLEAGEPAPPCGPAPLATVWFKVDPGAWRRLALHDALYDETATLWQGTSLGSLTSLGCFAPPARTDGATITPEPARWVVPDRGPFYLQIAQVYASSRTDKAFQMTSNESCSGSCLPPCQVRDHLLDAGIAPRDPWRWSFNVAGGLKGLSAHQILRSVKAGAKIVTASTNDCGLADKVTAKTSYLGTSRLKASMCNGDRRDRKNVVAVAPRGGGSTLAMTCYSMIKQYGEKKWHITESDMEVYANWQWTTDGDAPGCHDAQDLVGVLAHEVGHVFGLDHAQKGRARNLTMFPIAPPACNNSARSLGLGDVLGLRQLY